METLAPERRTSSSGLAPRKAACGVPQQKQKQEENCSRIEPNNAAGSCAEAPATTTSRASTTLLISPAPIRSVAAATERSKSRGGRALRISGRAVRCGSSSGNGLLRRPDSRASSAAPSSAGSSPGPRIALSVRNVSSPLRQSDSSGRTIEPGESEDQLEEAPPVWSKANPPSQTTPAPAGSRLGSSTIASLPVRRHSSATSAKRSSPREAASWATPRPANANPRSGCSQQNQRSDANREANTAAQGSSTSTSTVTLTRVLLPLARARSTAGRRLGVSWSATPTDLLQRLSD